MVDMFLVRRLNVVKEGHVFGTAEATSKLTMTVYPERIQKGSEGQSSSARHWEVTYPGLGELEAFDGFGSYKEAVGSCLQ